MTIGCSEVGQGGQHDCHEVVGYGRLGLRLRLGRAARGRPGCRHRRRQRVDQLGRRLREQVLQRREDREVLQRGAVDQRGHAGAFDDIVVAVDVVLVGLLDLAVLLLRSRPAARTARRVPRA